MTLSVQDALSQLTALSQSGNATVQAIRDIVIQVDATPPAGASVLLYSARLEANTVTADVIEGIADSVIPRTDISIIDKTDPKTGEKSVIELGE